MSLPFLYEQIEQSMWRAHEGPLTTIISRVHSVKSVLLPFYIHTHRMCVITSRLGCLHGLAHAAGRGNFYAPPRLGAPFLLLGLLATKTFMIKLAVISFQSLLCWCVFQACFMPRRALPGKTLYEEENKFKRSNTSKTPTLRMSSEGSSWLFFCQLGSLSRFKGKRARPVLPEASLEVA